MDLTPYVEAVKNGVTEASALADDHTRSIVERLGGSVESATRLTLIRALSDAAAVISADLAPTTVEVRMTGDEPDLVVRVAPSEVAPTLIMPQPPEPPEAPEAPSPGDNELDDEPTARISLRLPASVKAKVDEMADRDGISTNAWLQRAIMDALGESRPGRTAADSVRGLINAVTPFGPEGAFGPYGPFGPHGPFGDNARPRNQNTWEPKTPAAPRPPAQQRGKVQGWVR